MIAIVFHRPDLSVVPGVVKYVRICIGLKSNQFSIRLKDNDSRFWFSALVCGEL